MDKQESLFQFQLDLLMKEIDLIDHAIGRLDEILLRNRNWGTTLWAALSYKDTPIKKAVAARAATASGHKVPFV